MIATLVAPSFWLALAFLVQALIIVVSPAARLADIPEQTDAAAASASTRMAR